MAPQLHLRHQLGLLGREHGRELEGGYLAKQKQADEAEDSIEGYR